MDSQPYFDTLVRMQQKDPYLWGAMYTSSKEFDVYKLKEKPADAEMAQLWVRQVDINRNRAFDSLLEAMRAGEVYIVRNELSGKIRTHLQDMKRIRALDANNEFTYQWKKSGKGDDHFHHALLYAWVASKLIGLARSALPLAGVKFSMELENQP